MQKRKSSCDHSSTSSRRRRRSHSACYHGLLALSAAQLSSSSVEGFVPPPKRSIHLQQRTKGVAHPLSSPSLLRPFDGRLPDTIIDTTPLIFASTTRIRRQPHRRLTTKAKDDDATQRSWFDPFRKAAAKFKARPGTYLIIPCIAAIVGWFTNWLAVQMIFYPIHFRGIPLYIREEVPLGFLGWQGIVVSCYVSMHILWLQFST